MRQWRYSSTLHELGTRWKKVISFTPLPLYPPGKTQVHIKYEAGCCGKEKNLSTAENPTPAVQLIARPCSD
jgi:hypothetical protein